MFTTGYNMGYSFQNKKSKIVGHVYAIESFGSVLGGASATAFILSNLSPFSMVVIFSFANIFSAIMLNFLHTGAEKDQKLFPPFHR
jgi:hypothetical protein